MCGIVGYLNIDREDLASSMIDTLIHRGPDDRGVFFDKSIRLGLGHSRLSILDISMLGHQPMWSSDRQICLVFNGEIYNHLEIRERLKGKYTFRSTSDTETIIYAYQEYGIDCFRMFEGMFALAIYDYQSSKLILCRDRLGKKPLYWFFDGEHFVFASELKALMKSEYFKKEIDIDSVSKYLIYDYVPTPFTIWKDVFKLEPATYMIFDGKRIEKNKFWDINKPVINETFDNAKKNIDSMLDRSVSSRLISDVPLGIFLSGGLDSSTILYYAKRHRDSVDTFSIGFNEKSFDESAYAKDVSRYFGTNHHEKIFSEKECASSIFEVLSKVDEPVADASIIPTYLLSKFTSEYVTVSLGGDGGDELFAGYPTFQAYKYYQFIKKFPDNLSNYFIKIICNVIPNNIDNFSLNEKIKYFFKYIGIDHRCVHDRWLGSFRDDKLQDILSKDLSTKIDISKLYKSSTDAYYEINENEKGNKFLYQYLRGYLMDEVMVKVDRATMLNSLEARSPFLDYRLVEYCMSLPYKYKLRGMNTKYILKEIMRDRLPDGIVNRKKKGFGMPVAKWINGDLKEVFDDYLSDKSLRECGLFNADYVKGLLRAHREGKENNRKELWNIFTFMFWYRSYFK